MLELLCLEVGTSVASALTAETIFEIVKSIADPYVDMLPRGRMGSKREIFRFFQFWLRPRWNDVEFSTSGNLRTGNTLIKPSYTSASQST